MRVALTAEVRKRHKKLTIKQETWIDAAVNTEIARRLYMRAARLLKAKPVEVKPAEGKNPAVYETPPLHEEARLPYLTEALKCLRARQDAIEKLELDGAVGKNGKTSFFDRLSGDEDML